MFLAGVWIPAFISDLHLVAYEATSGLMRLIQIIFTRLYSHFFHKGIVIILALSLLNACDQFFYEEPTDNSKFINARLMQDDIVLFSYAHMTYRMAKVIAAFPDGGKAKYDIDRNILEIGRAHV